MDRRTFLKYASASAAVIGASALGLDYVLDPRFCPLNQHTTSLSETTTMPRINHVPDAGFKRKPWYLNPTDQQTIQFTDFSTDPGGDPLTYRWLVDNQPVLHLSSDRALLPR
jgi:hypothetical protein